MPLGAHAQQGQPRRLWLIAVLSTRTKEQDEVDSLIDLISTNHTHFFREPAHFDLLATHLLPRLAQGRQSTLEPLRLWSAAASSGEEAYTMAIVLGEFTRTHPWLHWQIDASDISNMKFRGYRECNCRASCNASAYRFSRL